ncbi:MAG: phosphatidate cytidylyltransferase [Planctomycetota bacterium]|nr:phosphatidate cytidylyltransferase [Planctomycetota bacterium]
MKRRIIFGSLLGAAALIFLVVDLSKNNSFGLIVLLAGFTVAAMGELYGMAQRKGILALPRLGMFAGFVLLYGWWRILSDRAEPVKLGVGSFELALGRPPPGRGNELLLLLALCMGVFVLVCLFRKKGEKEITGLAFTVFGFFYIAFLSGFILETRFLRLTNDVWPGRTPWVGAYLVLLLLITTKMTDVFGYLVGSRIGKRRIAPHISPKKSVEGLAAGIAGSIIAAVIFTSFTRLDPVFTIWQAALFGMVIAVVGQAGDLAESYIKRSLGSKDSSGLIPEFGGMLDLMDGVILAAPCGYAYFCWMGFGAG